MFRIRRVAFFLFLANRKTVAEIFPPTNPNSFCVLQRREIIAIFADMKSRKTKGQVFTPHHIVTVMLDTCGYTRGNILRKHIIDNSCGNGAFLRQVVERYCDEAAGAGISGDALRTELETYVHGIEIDAEAYADCIANLDGIVGRYDINRVNWDIRNCDTLSCHAYDDRMDYVVGNPPYVRVHNLKEEYSAVKSYSFANAGMTDLYLVFFEIGLNMLNASGKLCYITPVSWLNSVAGQRFRTYIRTYGCLSEFIDLEHFQPFEATTYTAISVLVKSGMQKRIKYSVFNGATSCVDEKEYLSYGDIFIGNEIHFAPHDKLNILRRIRESRVPKRVSVKNGFATLADNVFIGDLPFSAYTIDILKASTGQWAKGLFPYTFDGTPLSWEDIARNRDVADYLLRNQRALLKGSDVSDCPGWFLYGRTQAIKDVQKPKIAINNLIKDAGSIKMQVVPAGAGVYSGLYILSDESFETIREIVVCEEFAEYVALLKNYKSGGYYTFSSKDLEQYINYKLNIYYHGAVRPNLSADKRNISQGSFGFFQ